MFLFLGNNSIACFVKEGLDGVWSTIIIEFVVFRGDHISVQ